MKTDTKDKIVEFIRDNGGASPKEIASHVGISSQALFKHLMQLLRGGQLLKIGESPHVTYIIRDKVREKIIKMFKIPVYGTADCGDATQIAEQRPEGYVQVSNRIVTRKEGIFAVVARGRSMNRANINGKSIEEGDFVIVDSYNKTPRNGDYVLSVINGNANIKKFYRGRDQVVLISESSEDFAPIFIRPRDCDYVVNGRVIEVIKKPR